MSAVPLPLHQTLRELVRLELSNRPDASPSSIVPNVIAQLTATQEAEAIAYGVQRMAIDEARLVRQRRRSQPSTAQTSIAKPVSPGWAKSRQTAATHPSWWQYAVRVSRDGKEKWLRDCTHEDLMSSVSILTEVRAGVSRTIKQHRALAKLLTPKNPSSTVQTLTPGAVEKILDA